MSTFILDEAIFQWRRQMVEAGICDPEVINEFESHLRDDIEDQVRSGMRLEAAFQSAVQRLGPLEAIHAEFRRSNGAFVRILIRLRRFFTGNTEMPFPLWSEFGVSARQALEFARAEAPRLRHGFVGTEHILLGLLAPENGVADKLWARMGLKRDDIHKLISALISVGPPGQVTAAIPFTPRAERALKLATQEAKKLRHGHVEAEHILLGLLMEGTGVAAVVLNRLGAGVEMARDAVLEELASRRQDC